MQCGFSSSVVSAESAKMFQAIPKRGIIILQMYNIKEMLGMKCFQWSLWSFICADK